LLRNPRADLKLFLRSLDGWHQRFDSLLLELGWCNAGQFISLSWFKKKSVNVKTVASK